jgi:hypothetical protein
MSPKENQLIIKLIIKAIEGKLKEHEKLELDHWASLSADNRDLLNELMDKQTLIFKLFDYGNQDGAPIWKAMAEAMPALLSIKK